MVTCKRLKIVPIPKGIVYQNKYKYSLNVQEGKKKRTVGLFKTRSEALKEYKKYSKSC